MDSEITSFFVPDKAENAVWCKKHPKVGSVFKWHGLYKGEKFMLTAVTFNHRTRRVKGFCKRLFGGFERESAEIRGASFCHIRYYGSDAKIKWHRVAKTAGRERLRLLLPVGIEPPAGCGVARYDKNKFERACLTDIFCEILSSVHLRAAAAVVLVDEDGSLQATAERLIENAPRLIIYTNQPERYERFRDEAVYQYGTEPIVTGSPAAFEKAALVLAPFGKDKAFVPARTPVFGPAGAADYYIGEDSVVLPDDAARIMPAGLSKLEFLAALREQCGLSFATADFCRYLSKNGGKSSIKNAVLTISCLT